MLFPEREREREREREGLAFRNFKREKKGVNVSESLSRTKMYRELCACAHGEQSRPTILLG